MFLKLIIFAGIVAFSEGKLQCLPVTEKQCGENEAYTTCGSYCGEPKCPRYGFEELMCPAVCNEGCFCADGYVRGPEGKCIPLDACPVVTCPQNQHFSECGAACVPTCDNPVLLFCPYICMSGCVCDEGFVKNSEGECVKVEQCPPRQCGENEEFLDYGSPCESTCDHPGPIFCRAAARSGCFCKEGYVRDENYRCVLSQECPPVECLGQNEVFNDCGSTCGDLTCEVPSFAAVTCLAGCGRGCYCADGFVRNNDNVCVPVEACEPVGHCPANEYWTDCGPADGCEPSCDPQSPDIFCIEMCVPKCVCQGGYVRDSNYNCIPQDTCPIPQCGENEVYTDCGSGCGDLNCERRNLVDVACPAVCQRGCFCADGFVRDFMGKCIKDSECPTCLENERYSECGAACFGTCANPNPFICPAICMPGCICEDGLVRNEDGKCVEPSECPKIEECGENAHYTDCGSGCGDLSCFMQSYAAMICPDVCVPGCFCDEGYVRNENNECVLPSTCPYHGCKENEVWTDCGPVDSCEASCKNPDLIDVACPLICVQKCVCQEGYVRDANYNCVPRDSCGAVQCGENEFYTTCGSGCGDLTCKQPSSANLICPAVCRVGCFCTEGYVRDAAGKCIEIDQCPKDECGINEHFDECGANGCQNTCANPTFSWVCRGICTPGCICDEGYIRNSDGACVLPQECPTQECGENEEYQQCGIGGCQNTCENPELSTVCDPFGCTPGCYCSEGYIRNSDGKCVRLDECPTSECGKNQHYEECGVNGCENTCAQPQLEEVCRNVRCQEGCYCDEGYIRAPNGECVLPEDCPPQCGENEEYSECGAGACENTCDQPEKQLVCKAPCLPGCFCSGNTVRDTNGKCVLLPDCACNQ